MAARFKWTKEAVEEVEAFHQERFTEAGLKLSVVSWGEALVTAPHATGFRRVRGATAGDLIANLATFVTGYEYALSETEGVRLPDATATRLRAWAERRGLHMDTVIRDWVAKYVDQQLDASEAKEQAS